MKKTISELLADSHAKPIDVVNVIADYSSTGDSIGAQAGELFQRGLAFTPRQKTRLKNSLSKGLYKAVVKNFPEDLVEYARAIKAFDAFYGRS
jgi:hypothetical protein